LNGWFSKNLGDAMLVDDSLADIEQQFLAAYTKADNPTEMALFSRHESEGRLHCDLMLYLSPASFVVADEIGAKPCNRPSSNSLSLLVGSDDSWPALFPESGD